MTNKEAIEILEDEMYMIWETASEKDFAMKRNEAFDMAIEALKAPTKNTNTPTDTSTDLISRADAIKAIHNYWKKHLDTLPTKESEYGEVYADIQQMSKILEHNKTLCNFIKSIPSADRPQGKWIDCKELPSTDRNVFIAYGTDNMKSVCIGHYEHNMKLWYEDKNFFAKPIYDAMYWCEIPQFPTRMKGAEDED